MRFANVRTWIPSWQSFVLAIVSAVLLTLAFPDFDLWFLAWFALAPLLWAVDRENDSVGRSFLIGWLFGTAFFFGTCWWLTYAPIHYGGFPWPLAYFLILIACAGAGVFPGVFAAVLSVMLRRFGSWAFLAAPFVWVFSEFLRYWLTGNNWNAIGYSQAFNSFLNPLVILTASSGGLLFTSGVIALFNCFLAMQVADIRSGIKGWTPRAYLPVNIVFVFFTFLAFGLLFYVNTLFPRDRTPNASGDVIAIQPNVPMSGVDQRKLEELRQRQFDRAKGEIAKLRSTNDEQQSMTVILPESPMNFMYHDDREFQQFVRDFTTRNNVSLLFNSAEPDPTNGKYFNSAVMVGPDGREAVQYDKIYLLPFGEAVPPPLDMVVPGFVGNFSYGREYDIVPIGDANAGVMICFESHFGQLSRKYVQNGADVIIEMTNDGYLGPTPVLRQHLANAVFRAVETNRPVLRVTNVGITTYINERGAVLDQLPTYTEGTRVWTVSKSDGSQTFYVRYGDWFAWLCTVVTLGLLAAALKPSSAKARA